VGCKSTAIFFSDTVRPAFHVRGVEEPTDARRRRADSAPRSAPAPGTSTSGRAGRGGGGGVLDGLEEGMAAVKIDGGQEHGGGESGGKAGVAGDGEDGPEVVRDFLKRQGLEQYAQLLLDEG
jgi:hypothetical protein